MGLETDIKTKKLACLIKPLHKLVTVLKKKSLLSVLCVELVTNFKIRMK